jgi:hypothetical protein
MPFFGSSAAMKLYRSITAAMNLAVPFFGSSGGGGGAKKHQEGSSSSKSRAARSSKQQNGKSASFGSTTTTTSSSSSSDGEGRRRRLGRPGARAPPRAGLARGPSKNGEGRRRRLGRESGRGEEGKEDWWAPQGQNGHFTVRFDTVSSESIQNGTQVNEL